MEIKYENIILRDMIESDTGGIWKRNCGGSEALNTVCIGS